MRELEDEICNDDFSLGFIYSFSSARLKQKLYEQQIRRSASPKHWSAPHNSTAQPHDPIPTMASGRSSEFPSASLRRVSLDAADMTSRESHESNFDSGNRSPRCTVVKRRPFVRPSLFWLESRFARSCYTRSLVRFNSCRGSRVTTRVTVSISFSDVTHAVRGYCTSPLSLRQSKCTRKIRSSLILPFYTL